MWSGCRLCSLVVWNLDSPQLQQPSRWKIFAIYALTTILCHLMYKVLCPLDPSEFRGQFPASEKVDLQQLVANPALDRARCTLLRRGSLFNAGDRARSEAPLFFFSRGFRLHCRPLLRRVSKMAVYFEQWHQEVRR